MDQNGCFKKVHFIGIGGVGMSALAMLALKRGYIVSGSDISNSKNIDNLLKEGAVINIGHDGSNIDKTVSLTIFSSCIKQNNKEILKAKKLGIPVIHRSEFLAELMKNKISVAICGSHGKTTTSSVLYHILYYSDLSVSAAIGGKSYNAYENIERDTKYFVAEADESDGSFMNLQANYAIVTSLDKDHFDFYSDFDNMVLYFNRFLRKINDNGYIFLNSSLKKYKNNLLKGVKAKTVYYGFDKSAELNAYDVKLSESKARFKINFKGYLIGKSVETNLIGSYNVENVLAAYGMSVLLSVNPDRIKKSLKVFKGVRRRFQIRVQNSEFCLIEDYAHHPTEISAVIDAVKKCYKPKRIIGIFQPHRFTRTGLLTKELAYSLKNVDVLILTDIYSASEEPIKGVNSLNIYKYAENDFHEKLLHLPIEKISNYVLDILEKGDFIMVLGAGNINKVALELEKKLKLVEKT